MWWRYFEYVQIEITKSFVYSYSNDEGLFFKKDCQHIYLETISQTYDFGRYISNNNVGGAIAMLPISDKNLKLI